jgi:hypothetical protein
LWKFEMGHIIPFVLQLGGQTLQVQASSLDCVQSLEKFLPQPQRYDFYAEGLKICSAFSLKYVGVSSGSAVRAIPQPPERSGSLQLALLRGTRDRIAERRHFKVGLGDDFFGHVDGTVTSCRRLVNIFLSCNRPTSKQRKKAQDTVVPDVPARPPDAELPRFW